MSIIENIKRHLEDFAEEHTDYQSTPEPMNPESTSDTSEKAQPMSEPEFGKSIQSKHTVVSDAHKSIGKLLEKWQQVNQEHTLMLNTLDDIKKRRKKIQSEIVRHTDTIRKIVHL